MQSKKTKIFKLVMFVAFILIMIFLTTKLLPFFTQISTEEGRNNIKNEIESLGFDGMLIIIGLMVIQIFLPFLPRRAGRSFSGYVVWPNRRLNCNIAWCICK